MINIDNIINKLAKNLKLKDFQIKNTLSLISEGNTIPFISRYRKEFTNGLDEEQIFLIQKEYNYQLNLEEKKIWTINAIEKKGKLTDEIISLINSATKISELENIYKPYAEKKKTRAAIAINLGFEPLANYILTLPKNSIENEVKKYLKDDINYNQALQYVNDIIAEKVSDDYEIRNILKNSIFNYGFLTTKPSKIENDVEKKYKLYYETKLKLNK
ncbi:MAG: RNA-binding transcriptional accessory protein, partial [Candidatus Ureaplasma intestinipullorum]|nr:RNA-binding transcriptional accessory protein [Candidatus Ureaplasma intestinipullorum]